MPHNDQLDRELANADNSAKVQEAPTYSLIGDAKIPVSKHHGSIWRGRRDTGKKSRSDYEAAWKEAIRYFKNAQSEHREDNGPNRSGNVSKANKINSEWTETENVVFANVTTLLPALYAKNPTVEFTSENTENRPLATLYEHLIIALFNMKTAPGVNLKPKARKGVLNALLTNSAWLRIGWTFRESSSDSALQDLQRIEDELRKAKDQETIKELEGQLIAIEQHLDILEPEGPFVRFVSPLNVVIDPEAEEPDLSDARWIMECMYMPTEYLNARYGKKDDNGNIVSVYEPTHVLKANSGEGGGTSDVQDEIDNFHLFSEEKVEPGEYGYDDQESFDSAKRTLVWICWDKTTRRVYMYADNKWEWPLWVWEDPYQLLNFFPYYPMSFYDNPEGWYAKGEVSYYLDQQDAINEINDEERRARLWIKRNIMFDKSSISKEDVESFLNGTDGTAVGINLPEGRKMEEVVFSGAPPSIKFGEIFNVDRKLQAIDRISSVSDVLRGVQFKTNTTNEAIETYNSASQMRLDEKIDKIEDWIGDVAWGLAQLCSQFMSPEDVARIIGPSTMNDAQWTRMQPAKLYEMFSPRVVGGSTVKPTSRAKKQEATQVGQVLGQFADAAPAVIEIILQMFQQAFDEIVIRDEDWQRIQESIALQQQQAGAGPSGASGQSDTSGGGNGQLPPEAERAVQTLVERGIPEQQARQAIAQKLQQEAQGSTQ